MINSNFFKRGELIFWLTFASLVIISPFVILDKPEEFMFLPLTLVLGLGAIFFLNQSSEKHDRNFQISIFLLAFSLRLWAGFFLYGFGFGEALGDEDATGYISGWVMAQNWMNNGIDGFVNNLYAVFIGRQNVGQSMIWGSMMFVIGGPSRLAVSALNSFAGAGVVISVYRMTKVLFSEKEAKIVAICMTFWLSLILFSAGTSKEILVIFLEWTILYVIIRGKTLTRNDIFLLIPLLLALYTIRFYAFYMCCAVILIRFVTSGDKSFLVYLRDAAVAFVFISAFMFALSSYGVLERDREVYERNAEGLTQWRINVADYTGSGVVLYDEEQSSFVSIPVATAYFFFSPFPWELGSGSFRKNLSIPENLALMFLFVVGLFSVKSIFKEKISKLLPIVAFCVLYAGFHIASLANIGLAWRHKQTVVPLLFMFAAVGIIKMGATQREKKPQLRRQNPYRIT